MILDTLLDLHAKLSTVVRYYDRMLEERLSNTYNQHTIGGYNLPAQRPTSSIYPSLSSNISGNGPAENFYTGNAQPESYGRPQTTYSYAPSQQPPSFSATPGPTYPNPEQRSDMYAQYPPQAQPPQLQQTQTWQAPVPSATSFATQQPTYTPENGSQASSSMNAPGQAQAHLMNTPSQPPSNYAPSEQAVTPSADPNAAFYYNNAPQAPPPQQTPEQTHQQYAPAQSPQQYHAIPPQPQAQSPQQFTRQPQIPQEHHAPPPQQQAPQQQPPYWQAQQQNTAAQQAWQAPSSTYNGYTQESFPSAPHHAPQQKVMEESLIDL